MGNKAILIERSDIIAMRHLYLRKIRKYCEEGRKIIYLDETWVNVVHTTSKPWHECNIKCKGPRFIILSAGSDQGFVENARLVYLAKENTGDYHDEIDSSRRFEEWFKSQLLPNIKEDSVVVMDNASYHRIEYPEKRLKIELIKIVDSVRSKYTTYEVDETARRETFPVSLRPQPN
ncbi:hypothetical protein J437_LFUL009189 [Ladona fulva]|uniref:Tc1-like transposase DDE domain-containing protein n=1 Tax=Ladona fulva TaxID=123851 RepID=A0A8K0K8Y5_LADFU|nr:hypothetical protein J437_LFUL009189 [Ladona fulva]